MNAGRIFLPGGVLAGLALALVPSPTPAETANTAGTANTAKAAAAVDFVRDIKPLFEDRCVSCHGADKRKGGLRLTNRRDAFTPADTGEPVIRPGDPKGSLLLRRLSAPDDDRMPPEGARLSKAQIATIRRWISAGAVWPEGPTSAKHWAYVRPRRPALPAVRRTDWPKNAIDHFILERMEAAGFSPSPPASREVLLRRVSLDLTGLPPSPAEVDAFLADRAPDAYEKVVERLLASPRYGERWARLWLDLGRYADSNGYQSDQIRILWPYRDWVIKALNDDMPFDRFTIEQIAGDLLPGATLEQKIATGFHRTVTCNVEGGVDPEENRINQVLDRVNTTAAVWLGTTLECAQCHNHKYDPFTQEEYYKLFAYFNNTPIEVKQAGGAIFEFIGPKMAMPLDESARAKADKLKGEIAELEGRIGALRAVPPPGKPEDWERVLKHRGADARQHALEIAGFESEAGASHELLPDGSILVGGRNPEADVYTVTARTKVEGITAFKLEAMVDPSLPAAKGPGRELMLDQGNFVVTELSIKERTTRADTTLAPETRIRLHSPRASAAHPEYPVAAALDGDEQTGWAIHPAYHRPHHAVFLTGKPVGSSHGIKLTIRIEQKSGGQRTLGRLRLSAITGDATAPALDPDMSVILAKPAARRNPDEAQRLMDFYRQTDPAILPLRKLVEDKSQGLAAIVPVTTLVMVEMDRPRQNHVFKRGSFLDRGMAVSPGTPAVLHALPPGAPANRLGLARWLVDPENPLVGRVAVNRWWTELLGRGLVETPEDFGVQGERPTHSALLDWLAVELAERGWSTKHIHRLIVTSATYRQSSTIRGGQLDADPYNRRYARGPRHRLAAEMIRDNALAAGGLLSTKMGGPPVFPPQPAGLWRHIGRSAPSYTTSTGEDRFRRGVYVVWRRSAPYASFVNFDAPDRASCTVRRARTNTPLQALTLLNDPAYVEMAMGLARRLLVDLPRATEAQRVAHAFRLVLARAPRRAEADHLLSVYRRERRRLQGDPGAARALVDGLKEVPAAPGADPAEQAAWFFVANVLLNLDETITKG